MVNIRRGWYVEGNRCDDRLLTSHPQAMDQFPVLGHQMTHSLDSFMTDSANSAMSIYTGHKSMINCLGICILLQLSGDGLADLVPRCLCRFQQEPL